MCLTPIRVVFLLLLLLFLSAITFALLSTLLFGFAIVTFTGRLSPRRASQKQKRLHLTLLLRKIEALLITAYKKQHMEDVELGSLLLLLHSLQNWGCTSAAPEMVAMVKEDVESLRSFELTPEQKMLVVQRLFRARRLLTNGDR